MTDRASIDEIYEKHKQQIHSIVEAVGGSYNKASIIVSWFYGGSSERWRKVLPKKKSVAMPKEVKEFLKGFKTK